MAREPMKNGASLTKKPIKVKQDMIDFIKEQGMTAALKRAGELKASGAKGEAEFLEGVRRMYGARRLSEATMAAKPVAKSADAARATAKPVAKKAVAKKVASKGMSTKEKALAVGGTAAAVGALVLSKGKAAGLASKLSPGLAKSSVGKLLIGKPMTNPTIAMRAKMADKATSAKATAGRVAAKAGKPVSQTTYDAMVEAAKAKGMTAAKAAASKAPVKKAVAKKAAPAPKKAAAPVKKAVAPKPVVKAPTKKALAAAALMPGQKKGK